MVDAVTPPPAVVSPVVVPPVVSPSDPWFKGITGVDDSFTGHWTNRGLNGKSPAEIAVAMTKAHMEAERYLGAPRDQLVRVPKDAADEAGWGELYGRLGVPKDAAGYDFTAVKGADGQPLDAKTTDFIRATAVKMKIPAARAAEFAQEFVRWQDGVGKEGSAEQSAKLAQEKDALAKNWGPNLETNKFIARRAAEALGVQPAEVEALESVVGYARVMEMFRSIGQRTGEHKFIDGGSGNGNNGVMTKDQAQARMNELKGDTAWVSRYLAGGRAEAREMADLNQLIVAGAKAAGW